MSAASSAQESSVTVTTGDSTEALLLRTVASLVGAASVSVVTTTEGEGEDGTKAAAAKTTSLVATSANRFAGREVEERAVGWTGCARWLARRGDGCPPLAGATAAERAAVDSWMDAAESQVQAAARQGRKEGIFQQAVQQFARSIEDHLSDGTCLVGSGYTVADVACAVVLAAASAPDEVVPARTRQWMTGVLSRASQFVIDKDDAVKLQQWCAATEKKEAATTPAPSLDEEPAAVVAAEAGDNAILALLRKLQIPHEVYSHPLCTTAEELVENVPVPTGHTHTKNLFLRDKKHGLFLVTVRPAVHVNTKELGKLLRLEGKTNLRLADEAVLDEKLHVRPGCVGPLCMGLADAAAAEGNPKEKVTLVLDEGLLTQYDMIHSHPLRNDMSVKMTPAALLSYLHKVGAEPVKLEFSVAAEQQEAAPAREQWEGKAPANRPLATRQQPQQPAGGKKPQAAVARQDKKTAKKGETLLALQWKKDENFAQWYTDVIVLSEMISYYDISGCYILRPWSYKMWELIQEWFNRQIGEMGVENTYFPLFVSQDRLEREKDHVEGFAPEVAWVTKSGEGELARPIAIRPTSETIMYPAYSDWIKSHRDLPLKLNQWSNVVRWEFKYPTPFLRTREFLWQEGHTAHSTTEDAEDMVMKALDLYRQVYEDLLAVPVVPGYKTEKEKFAGGYRTTTVEAYIAGSGRAIQGATSHHLGQNFGKMFDITFQDDQGKTQTAYQTSWGLTTRTIGVMVMVHGDDKGLVLPPRIAPLQVVIVPIVTKKFASEQADPYCLAVLADLKKQGIRAKYDERTMYNPGWKYNHWEQKGVPLRIEVGPRDVEQKSVRLVVRHDGSKEDHPVEGLGALIANKLDEIQTAMFTKAKTARDTHIVKVTEWKDFVPALEKNNLVLTPWCGGEHEEWEEWVKAKSREESLQARGEEAEDDKTATSVAAKTLCIPFKQPEMPADMKCIASGLPATCWVLWGRSY